MLSVPVKLYPILLLCLVACTYQKFTSIDPSVDCKTVIPDTLSFNNHVLPIFNANCNLSGCHSGSEPAGGLNLEPSKAYAQLSKRGSGYIDTIHPTRSVLYSSLVSVSDPMPPNGKLDACSIALIAKWMEEKGKNN